jgi:arylsulfatase A-like enzyme
VPAGRVSDEIVHAIDLFPTLAGITGADVPKDRPIDGVVAVSLNGRFAPRAALPVRSQFDPEQTSRSIVIRDLPCAARLSNCGSLFERHEGSDD